MSCPTGKVHVKSYCRKKPTKKSHKDKPRAKEKRSDVVILPSKNVPKKRKIVPTLLKSKKKKKKKKNHKMMQSTMSDAQKMEVKRNTDLYDRVVNKKGAYA